MSPATALAAEREKVVTGRAPEVFGLLAGPGGSAAAGPDVTELTLDSTTTSVEEAPWRTTRKLRMFMGSAIGIYFLGAFFGQKLYVLIAALMFAQGFAEWRRCRTGLERLTVTVRFPTQVPAGGEVSLEIGMRSEDWVDNLELLLDLERTGDDPPPGLVLKTVGPGAEASESLVIAGLPRGRHPLHGLALDTAGDLGLIRRSETRRATAAIEVYPVPRAPLRMVSPPLEPLEVMTGVIPGPASPGSGDNVLRPWASGDGMRRIDWRATARLGEIVVLSTRLGPPDRVLVLVDDAPGPRFESVLEVGSWVAERLAGRRLAALCLAGDDPRSAVFAPAGFLAQARSRLAAAQPGESSGLRRFLARIARHLPECEILVVSATPPQLPSIEGFPMGFVVAGSGSARRGGVE